MGKKHLRRTKYSLLMLFFTFYVAATGSAIAQDGAIPPPPALTPQEFCFGSIAIIENLKVEGSNIVWYNQAEGGAPLPAGTTLVTGAYYAARRVGEHESPRTAVTVITDVNVSPLAALLPQVICSDNAIVANLQGVSSNVVWYDRAEGGTPLSAEIPLITGTYYAAERIGNCESARTAVAVEIVESPC